MAHWEERDPRWLVTELGKEGSNVNGWHWEDKNKMPWCKSRLKELLKDLKPEIKEDEGDVELTGLQELSGEANLSRRKGNKIFMMYDLHLSVGWTGKVADEDNKGLYYVWRVVAHGSRSQEILGVQVTGKVNISEFSTGSDEGDYIISTSCDNSDAKYERLTAAMQRLKPKIVAILAQFDKEALQLQE